MINTIPCNPKSVLPLLKMMYEIRMPLFLWGKPGIGKSDIVRQFARENNMGLIDLRLTTLESVDLRGLPWIKDGQTQWMRPEFIPILDEPTIIFLDELTAAEPRIQASSYQLVLDRCIGSHKLPDKVWVLGAGNAPEDGAISYAMGTALADRFCHVQIVPDAQSWIEWAIQMGLSAEVITFIKIKPEFLDGNGQADKVEHMVMPSPRSWERVSQVLSACEIKEVRQLAVNGLVGEAVSVQFFYVVDEVGRLPSIESLMKMTPQKAAQRIPASLSALYGLTYSLVSYSNKLEDLKQSMMIFEELTKIKDESPLPRAEIQTLGMEMLLGKASRIKLLDKLLASKDYNETYRAKARQLVV